MFLYRRGLGARRRVMHLTGFNPRTGEATMAPLCGSPQTFNTICNLPLGRPVCRRCLKAAA